MILDVKKCYIGELMLNTMSCALMTSVGKIRRCEMQIKLICTKCVPDNYKNVIGEIKM